MLAIEIDGRQHKLPEHKMSDAHRDKELEALGITVLRYANRDINRNFRVVCEDILRHLELEASDLKQQTSEEDQ